MQIVNFIKDSTVECSPLKWGLTLFSFGCNLHCKMCEGYNYETVTNKDNIIGEAKDIIFKDEKVNYSIVGIEIHNIKKDE